MTSELGARSLPVSTWDEGDDEDYEEDEEEEFEGDIEEKGDDYELPKEEDDELSTLPAGSSGLPPIGAPMTFQPPSSGMTFQPPSSGMTFQPPSAPGLVNANNVMPRAYAMAPPASYNQPLTFGPPAAAPGPSAFAPASTLPLGTGLPTGPSSMAPGMGAPSMAPAPASSMAPSPSTRPPFSIWPSLSVGIENHITNTRPAMSAAAADYFRRYVAQAARVYSEEGIPINDNALLLIASIKLNQQQLGLRYAPETEAIIQRIDASRP